VDAFGKSKRLRTSTYRVRLGRDVTVTRAIPRRGIANERLDFALHPADVDVIEACHAPEDRTRAGCRNSGRSTLPTYRSDSARHGGGPALGAVGDRVVPFTLAGARVKACLECPPRIRSRFPSM